MFFFLVFFFSRNNQTQETLYSIFFSIVDDQPIIFEAVIHLMREKRDWDTNSSSLLLMAIRVQAWGSL